jgi:hypothetical protein
MGPWKDDVSVPYATHVHKHNARHIERATVVRYKLVDKKLHVKQNAKTSNVSIRKNDKMKCSRRHI